jgi:hypothetical protein
MSTADRVRQLIHFSQRFRDQGQDALAIAEARRAVGYARTLENDVATLADAEFELGSALLEPEDQSDEQLFREGLDLLMSAAERFKSIGSVEEHAALLEVGECFRRMSDRDRADRYLGTVYRALADVRWQGVAKRAVHLQAVAALRIGQLVLEHENDANLAMKWLLEAGGLFLSGEAHERPWVEFIGDLIGQEIADANEVVAGLRHHADERWGPAR